MFFRIIDKKISEKAVNLGSFLQFSGHIFLEHVATSEKLI